MKTPLDDIFIDELLMQCMNAGACELIFESEMPPRFRRRGENEIIAMPYETPRFAVLQRLIYDILEDDQIRDLEREGISVFIYYTPYNVDFGVIVMLEKFAIGMIEECHINATFHLIHP